MFQVYMSITIHITVKPEIIAAKIFSVLGIHGILTAIKIASVLCMHSYIQKIMKKH